MTADEGYLALAFDDPRYLDLAANLALSVRRSDTRPISVAVHEGQDIPQFYRPLFDRVIRIAPDPSVRGAMNKVRMIAFTPYLRTMYVDADCLMVNAKADFGYPIETSQLPLLRALGAEHKSHVLFEGGHIPVRIHEMIKAILDWFDAYMGPVKM